ncbi:MAG TPA: hypothetical protein VLA33_06680 [Gemmatimonadota bacterium]|nr:hypothetical protein [Gemmatimonadota bacterium]
MSAVRRWLIPSYGAMLALAALATALVLRGAHMFAHDGDGARHIRLGYEILERGQVLQTDVLSHTRAGDPIVLHEWLSEVALAWANGAAGLPGVAVLATLLFTVAVWAVYWSAEELGALRPLALLVGLLALLLHSIHLLPRPHLFTTALAAVYMVLLLRFARTARWATLAPLPVLMVVWANLHGGFLLGLVLISAFVVGALLDSAEFAGGRRAARPLAVVLVACLAASLVTPHGLELWAYTTGHLGGDDFLLSVTEEFRSVDFHRAYGRAFLAVLFAGPALWMTGRVRVSWLGAGLYLFFAASALHSARNIPLFALATLPWFAVWAEEALEGGGGAAATVLARLRRMDRGDRLLRPWGWTLADVGLVAWALGPNAAQYQFDPGVFPVRAVDQLDQIDTSGHVFNQMPWGGYLLYAAPEIPVFIDGQTDFYGEELAREYLLAVNGRAGWRDVLDRHAVEWTLIGTRQPLAQLLALDAEWSRVYTDDVAVVYRRNATVSR